MLPGKLYFIADVDKLQKIGQTTRKTVKLQA